jgi:hypothetical protein
VSAPPASFAAGPMFLLSNGNILVQDAEGNDWRQLVPDSTGSYALGTWPADLVSTLPTDAAGFNAPSTYDATVLPDGRIFILGGEYANGVKPFINSGAIFDPTAIDPTTGNIGTWTATKPVPIIWAGQPIVGDDPLAALANGTVLVGNNNGPANYVGGDLGELNAAISASATSFVFYNTNESLISPPAAPFLIDVEREIMLVTNVSGSTWTVTRGQDGTQAAAHGVGASIDLVTTLAAPISSATATTIQVPASSGLPGLGTTSLNADVADGTITTVHVASASGFPLPGPELPYTIQVGQEMMTVTGISGNSLTVIRGVQGTTAAAHPKGTSVDAPYFIQIDEEIMEVTGISADGTTLTVIRGAQSTTPAPHAGGTLLHLSSDYAETLIFDPTSGNWTTLPPSSDKLQNDSAFEESWVKIPGTAGQVLTYNNNAEYEYNVSQGQYYDPATQTWMPTGLVPVSLANHSFSNETGPALQLPDGDIFQIGGNGQTALYHPSRNAWTAGPMVTDPLTSLAAPIASAADRTITVASATGVPATPFWIAIDQEIMYVTKVRGTSWAVDRGQFLTTATTHAQGASVPELFIPGDSPAAELPDGEVIFNAGKTLENTPGAFFDFDPATNTITPLDVSAMPGDLLSALANDPDDGTALLMLPTGQMMFTDGVDNNVFLYTPSGAGPSAASLPTIAGISQNPDGTFTLTGTQLNGVSEGAFYGDDEGMSENYPLVQLEAADGTIYYARTFDWSTMAVATGATPETTEFALPAGLPMGTYTLYVNAVGIRSQPYSFTLSSSASFSGAGARPLSAYEGIALPESTVLASFTTTSFTEPPESYSVLIDWGDGTSSAGAVVTSGASELVLGGHTYGDVGSYAISVQVTQGTGSATFQTSAKILQAPLPPGSPNGPDQRWLAEVYHDVFGVAIDTRSIVRLSKMLGRGRSSTVSARRKLVQRLLKQPAMRKLADTRIVQALYESILGTPASVAATAQALKLRSKRSKGGALSQLTASLLAQAGTGGGKVSRSAADARLGTVIYSLYFGGATSAPALPGYIKKLTHGASENTVIAGMAASSEFYLKTAR